MATRTNGTMAERSPGVWRLMVTTGYKPNGMPIRKSRTFKGSKRQASAALAAFHTDVQRGDAPMAGSTTLGEFLDRWIAHISSTRSPTTVRGYKDKAKRVKARLGTVKLERITAQHLDIAYRAWLDEGLSETSVHHYHGLVSAALNQAVKWGLVPRAVTELASPPPLRTKAKKVPTPDVIQRLIDAAESSRQPMLGPAIAMLATTGMRRGELLGLRWTDIDFEKRTITVARSVKHDEGTGWLVGDTKTHQERTISLDDFTIAVLREHRARMERSAADASVAIEPDGFIFTLDPTGREWLRPDSLGQAFARICKKAGVEGVSLHTLRHFSASVLVASGRDVRTIAGRLGHANANTTLRVYAHMVEGRDRDAADFLGALMATRPAELAEWHRG